MKRALALCGLLTLAAAAGCHPSPALPPPSPADPPRMAGPKMMVQRGANAAAPVAQGPLQLQADVYQLSVPFGSVSQNETFWKRVDEHCVDVATYDLLFKNGIRVGQAPVGEWNHFRQIMEQHPALTKVTTLVSAQGKPIDLPVRKEVVEQTIFYFDAANEPQGRSYDACENVVTIELQPAPRKDQTMRVALCPVVRTQRKRLEFSSLNRELGEIVYAAPERLYNVNLRTDVPIENFLVVAPSSQAAWPTSIGSSFFVTDGVAERMETVLLIVPKLVRMEPAK